MSLGLEVVSGTGRVKRGGMALRRLYSSVRATTTTHADAKLRRALLYGKVLVGVCRGGSSTLVPGSNPRMIQKSTSLKVDNFTLDLEDAVAPNKKEEARRYVRDALNGVNIIVLGAGRKGS